MNRYGRSIPLQVMQPKNSPRHRARISSVFSALTAIAVLGAPPSALGAQGPAATGDLSPRLAELAKPAVRSGSPAEQAKALGLASEGPGSLQRDGNRILVEVRFDHGAAASADDLRAAGMEVVGISPRYQSVTVAAKPGELRALSRVPRALGAREVLKPIAYASQCPSGKVVSEGVQQLHAGEGAGTEARSEFGVDGSGVTVGILSDSFNRATEAADGSGPIATKAPKDVENGDLPGLGNTCIGQAAPVRVLGGDPEAEGADEGRGMAQIVHDIAPGSDLAFATAFTPDVFGFAENIEKLAEPILAEGANADVIADDVVFFEEPFFQEGPVANAVHKVTEEGVTYLSAAGNDNLFDSSGNEIASWEAEEFRDGGSCPPAVVSLSSELEATQGFGLNPAHCLDFNPGAQIDRTFGIEVAPGATLSIDLQWAEPWNGVGTDLDAFLLNSTGGLIAASGEDNIGNSQLPFEFVQWENESASPRTVQLVVNRYSGGSPRLKLALLENGFGVTGTEYPRSSDTDVVGPTVFGHSGSADAISVGAVPFDDGAMVEPYSSRGPVTHYFGPVEGTKPAEALTEAETLSKPDVLATDCGATTFFARLEGLDWRFCGTSAAAPHAAGVAALMLDKQAASPGEVRDALLAGATHLAGFGPCARGAGLVEAVGAIEALIAHTAPTEPDCVAPGPEVSVEEARAPGDWGSESPPSTPVVTTQATLPPERAAQPAPRTFFRKRPPKVIRTRRGSVKLAFLFGSDEAGVTFLCKVDGGRFRGCPARFSRRYSLGRHVVRVKARNADGTTGATPVVFRFRVEPLRRGALPSGR
jgi:hypothetical protein